MRRVNLLLLFIILAFSITAQHTSTKEVVIDVQHELNNIQRSSLVDLPYEESLSGLSFVENDVLSAGLKRRYGIKTYDIYQEETLLGKCTWSASGIYYTFKLESEWLSIFPSGSGVRNMHTVQWGHEDIHGVDCGEVPESEVTTMINDVINRQTSAEQLQVIQQFGDRIRTYRMAVITTGEFYELNGNNDTDVSAVVTASIQGLSLLYERELSIRFNLVLLNMYQVAETDPFTPDMDFGASRTRQAGREIDALWDPSQYDIGHVLHRNAMEDGWSTGGLALINGACNDNKVGGYTSKAQGWSGSFANAGFAWISLFGHEVAHQFGATHTFNASGEACEENISRNSAYEIGSGTTIMSYNGLCADGQNIPPSGVADNYFHIESLKAIINHINLFDCSSSEPAINTLPEATANVCGAEYVIPLRTPFYVKGRGDDADVDPLTFTWEQVDEDGPGAPTQGFIGDDAANTSLNAPLFRSYPPNPRPDRYFPSLKILKNGANSDPFEVLPNRPRTIELSMTVRDNHPGGTAIDYDNIEIDVVNAGPLEVNDPVNWTVGESTLIEWNTNGTSNLCDVVSIKLSIDGGSSYPYTLADGIPYGDEQYEYIVSGLIPANNSSRIMITCEDYECFKIFNVNTTDFEVINPECELSQSLLCHETDIVADRGSNALFLDNLTVYNGSKISEKSFTTSVSDPSIPFVATDPTQTTCQSFPPQGNYEFFDFALFDTDTYELASDQLLYSLFDLAGFDTDDMCSSFIFSNSIVEVPDVNAKAYNSVPLEGCRPIRMVSNLNSGTMYFDRPVIALDADQPEKVYFFVVSQETNNIVSVLESADFRNLEGGAYTVYGVSATASTDLSTYEDQPFGQYYEDADCFRVTSNSFNISIEENCILEDVTIGPAGACNPESGTYLQPVTLTYGAVAAGTEIVVNGENYELTTSPQTIEIELTADGLSSTLDIYLSTEENCVFDIDVVHQDPCCPFDVDLGEDRTFCIGEEVVLSSNVEGVEYAYEWLLNDMVIATTSQIIASTTGTYTLSVTNETNCTVRDEVDLVFTETPTLSILDTVTLCEDEESVIIASTNATFLSWYLDEELVQEGAMKSFIIKEPGTLRTVAGAGNCTVEAITEIIRVDPPMPDLGGDKVGCIGADLTLMIDDSYTQITWYKDGIEIATDVNEISINEGGQYVLTAAQGAACTGSDTIMVQFLESPTLELPQELELCAGGSSIIDTDSEATDFTWYRNGEEIADATESTYEATQPGTYRVVASFDGACEVEATTELTEIPIPEIDLGEDISACEDENVVIEGPLGNYEYVWQRNNLTVSQNRSYTPDRSGVYTLEVIDDKQCKNSASITVDLLQLPSFNISSSEEELCEDQASEINIFSDADEFQWSLNGEELPGETDESLSIVGGGEYSVFLLGANGCTLDTTISIINLEAPTVDLGPNVEACLGDSITLMSSNPESSHEWIFKNGVIATTPMINVTQPGNYRLIDTNPNGCSDEDEVSVTFIDPPSLIVAPIHNFCEGLSTEVEVSSNASQFEWYFNDQLIPNESSSNITVADPGTYSVVATLGICTAEDTFSVNEVENPDIELGENTTLCPGESLFITAGEEDLDYIWNVDATGNSYEIQNDNVETRVVQNISVVATNQFECMSRDTVTIELAPVVRASVQASEDFICRGDTLTVMGSGGQTMVWSGGPFEQISSNEIIVFPETTTQYSLTVSNECPDNTDTENFTIEVRAAGTMTAGQDTCVIEGNSIDLIASGGVDYEWEQHPTILTDTETARIEVEPVEETTYFVNITDINGCMLRDNVRVCIISDPTNIIKPISVITPNGDNLNDELYFEGLDLFRDTELSVYNRWGDLIFRQADYQRQGLLFNGDDAGDEIPTDTYYYILKFDDQTIKSTLTIVREK